MNIDKFIFAFAGLMIVISLSLGYWIHSGFFLFTGFIGINMFQAAFTGFCPLAIVLKKIGIKSGKAF